VKNADIRYRNGHAHIARFPFINGFEAAGTNPPHRGTFSDVLETRNPPAFRPPDGRRSARIFHDSPNEENAMSRTVTQSAPRRAPDRFPLYLRSNGDITLLEISVLGAEPTTQDEQAIRLAVAGEIDILTAGSLRDTLIRTLHRYRPVHIDVDLDEVTFMDASGASALLKFAIAARQADCAITVTNPQSNVYRMLEITGLLDEFEPPTDRIPPVDTSTVADSRPALARRADAVVDAHADPLRRRTAGPTILTPAPHEAA
jgi:anti-anti-sigma factor